MVIPQLIVPPAIANHNAELESTRILRTHLGNFLDHATRLPADSGTALPNNDNTSLQPLVPVPNRAIAMVSVAA